MTDPEIDRRCSACGAAIRRRAMFCPQCGKPVVRHDELAETVELKLPDPTRAAESADTIALEKTTLEAAGVDSNPGSSGSNPSTPNYSSPAPTYASTHQLPGSRPPRDEVDGSARAKVERLRKASSVVIEQAHYDPSIRFLLVTAGLFILFILLLVLSKILG
jgi:endogenous inhibitor of DNA gyrase (YacG/DUF329 family)